MAVRVPAATSRYRRENDPKSMSQFVASACFRSNPPFFGSTRQSYAHLGLVELETLSRRNAAGHTPGPTVSGAQEHLLSKRPMSHGQRRTGLA